MSLELVTPSEWNDAVAAGRSRWSATGYVPDIYRTQWGSLTCCFDAISKMTAPAQSVWDEPAAAFGEAVVMELRCSVFRPFLRDSPSAPQVTPVPDGWAKIRQDRATLGQMLFCLRQVRESTRKPDAGRVASPAQARTVELSGFFPY
jgi:hypothetical protein